MPIIVPAHYVELQMPDLQDQKHPNPGDIVPCGGGGKPTKYEPPYLPNECLCDKCDKIVGEMIRDGEIG